MLYVSTCSIHAVDYICSDTGVDSSSQFHFHHTSIKQLNQSIKQSINQAINQSIMVMCSIGSFNYLLQGTNNRKIYEK